MTTATMPKHIKDAGDQAAKDIEAIRQGKDPDAVEATPAGQGEQGAAGQPTAQTTQENAKKDAKDEAIERLQAENQQLRKALNDEDGKRGGKLQKLQAEYDILATQLATATKTIGEQAEVIRNLNAGKSTTTGDSIEDALAIVGDDFVREYGKEIPQAAMKLIRSGLERVKSEFKAELDAIKEQARREREAGQQSEEERRANETRDIVDRVWGNIEKQYPGARMLNGDVALKLNGDPLWLQFCKERDPETRVVNSVIGEQAFQDAMQGDSAGITAFVKLLHRFDAWKAQRNGTGPRSGEQRVDTGNPGDREEGPRGPAGGAPEGGTKPTVKQSEFDAFMLDYRLNPKKYSMAEVAKRQTDYREAAMEGRLIQDVK